MFWYIGGLLSARLINPNVPPFSRDGSVTGNCGKVTGTPLFQLKAGVTPSSTVDGVKLALKPGCGRLIVSPSVHLYQTDSEPTPTSLPTASSLSTDTDI